MNLFRKIYSNTCILHTVTKRTEKKKKTKYRKKCNIMDENVNQCMREERGIVSRVPCVQFYSAPISTIRIYYRTRYVICPHLLILILI